MKLVKESLNESFALNEAISPKDWDRMLDLVLKGDEGETAAKLIGDKNKAISRFVCGLKLANCPPDYNEGWKEYRGSFSALGDKALTLGATPKEIQNIYDSTEVPQNIIEKQTQRAGKKLRNRFVGSISKAVLDAGLDITYLPHNGYAITMEGKDAMSRNGRKWTIGYKAEIDLGDKKVPLIFDAITDEGDGPTYYVIDHSSDPMFRAGWGRIGKNEFIAGIRSALEKYK